MLIVIPVSRHDSNLIKCFCDAINFFGDYDNHKALIVSRPSDIVFAKDVYNKLKCFKNIKIHTFSKNGTEGWPEGPNFYWHETIRYLKRTKNKLPWFWMELDTTPIKENWIDDLEKEYNSTNRKFLGMFQSSPSRPRKDGEDGIGNTTPYKHLVGVAVYPPNMHEYSMWKKSTSISLAFDVLCEREIIPQSKCSMIMQNCFRTEEYRCTNDGIKGIDKQHRASGDRYDFLITKNTSIVHGCNDGSLSNLILNKKINNKKEDNSYNNLPVFLHIPKCAGTYTISLNYLLLRLFRLKNINNNIKRIIIIKNKQEIMSLFCFINNKNFGYNIDNDTTKCSLDYLFNNLNKINFVFSIIIEPYGANLINNGKLKLLFNKIKRTPIYYTTLRKPIDFANSFYSYIKSQQSRHEDTHNIIKSKTFNKYVCSNEIIDSWITRNILGINKTTKLTDDHFNSLCKILNSFIILPITKVEFLINSIFKFCYNLNISEIPDEWKYMIEKNKTINKKGMRLTHKQKVIFNNKIKYDNKIYNKYCKTK